MPMVFARVLHVHVDLAVYFGFVEFKVLLIAVGRWDRHAGFHRHDDGGEFGTELGSVWNGTVASMWNGTGRSAGLDCNVLCY